MSLSSRLLLRIPSDVSYALRVHGSVARGCTGREIRSFARKAQVIHARSFPSLGWNLRNPPLLCNERTRGMGRKVRIHAFWFQRGFPRFSVPNIHEDARLFLQRIPFPWNFPQSNRRRDKEGRYERRDRFPTSVPTLCRIVFVSSRRNLSPSRISSYASACMRVSNSRDPC